MAENRVFFDKDRNVIPRWRDFHTTVAIGELNSADDFEGEWEAGDNESLASKLQAWNINKTVPFAADVINAAFVLGEYSQAEDAAKFILANPDDATETLKSIANHILNPPTESRRLNALREITVPTLEQLRHRIHTLRLRLRDEPRNAIAHVELARAYTLLDQRERAKMSMRMALKLASNNRFVLRSASRLFVHTGDLDEAHGVLSGADATKFDPWLSAAEIAAASAAERGSRFAKSGERLLNDLADEPFEITELASALATLEMNNAQSKNARKLFRRALISPTENSLAQIEWASRRIAGLDFVRATAINIPRNHEAQAWEYFTDGNWAKSRDESWMWLDDQSFSGRPAYLASFITGLLGDVEGTEVIVKRALVTNPGDPLLLNNLAFAYASANHLEQATDLLALIDEVDQSSSTSVTVTATRGLVEFRTGRIKSGRAFYQDAIDKSRFFSRSLEAMAALYHAREELIAGSKEAAHAVKIALELTADLEDKHVIYLKKQIEDMVKQRSQHA